MSEGGSRTHIVTYLHRLALEGCREIVLTVAAAGEGGAFSRERKKLCCDCVAPFILLENFAMCQFQFFNA